MTNISIILEREFLERVKKKSFIITTVLMPILMVGLMCLPALLMLLDTEKQKTILVVDATPDKIFAQGLTSNDIIKYVPTDMTLQQARNDEDVNSVVYFPADIVENRRASLLMYNNGSSSMACESQIASQVNDIITDKRMAAYEIGDLKKIIEETQSNVNIQTFSNDNENESEASSTTLSYVLGIGLSLLLYMALIMYGQMVMTSIIEEKNNRVLELVVTSVKPFHLMLGKIGGVGLVAVTQLVIWGILIALGIGLLIPALLPAEVVDQISQAQSGAMVTSDNGMDLDFVHGFATLMNPSYIIGLFFWLIVYLVGGFLIYASIFAAIGSAVDNIQDASQFTSFALIPIILGVVLGQMAAMDPESTIAIVASYFPLTSPMVMMSRLPFGVPVWETIVAAVILYASVIFFIWMAGKIYRVGIFMYGKKPTVKEIARWIKFN